MSPFRSGDGRVAVLLDRRERALLAALPALVGSVGEGDPAWERLHPPAYADDEGAQRDFRRFAEPEVERSRRHDRERFQATVDDAELTLGDAEAWVRVIGEARLVLASVGGVSRPEDLDRPHDPRLVLVAWLAHLQDALVRALPVEAP